MTMTTWIGIDLGERVVAGTSEAHAIEHLRDARAMRVPKRKYA